MSYISRIILLLSLPLFLFADETDLSGYISDKMTGEPLVLANVYFKDYQIGTVTNEDGYFSMSNLPSNASELIVSMMGYETIIKSIQLPIEMPLQIKMEKKLIEMSSIVTTGTRTERYLKDTPVTTQVLKGEKLRDSGSVDASQILDDLTGVSIVEAQYGIGIELSGYNADHVLILTDGMEVIGRTRGQLDISQIASDQIERIEVVKGAASALYGSDAMGGIVNIITKKPQKGFGLIANSKAGSNGRFNGNITLANGYDKLQTKFNFGVRRYGGHDVNHNSLYLNGNRYNKYSSGIRLESDDILKGILRFDNKIFFERQKFNNENVFEDVTDNLRISNKMEYEGNRNNLKYKTGLEFTYYEHEFNTIVLSSGNTKSSDETINGQYKSDITIETSLLNHQLNGGLGYEIETISTDRIRPSKKSSNLLFGFAQDEWQLNQKAILLTGVRIDNHSLFGNYISPKFSAMFKPEPISRIRLSYGRGFKAPTFKEMFLDFTTPVNLRVIGNPNLDPEISDSYIFDIERWHTARYHGRVNFYYNEIQNLIDYVHIGFDENGRPLWQYVNINKAITKGIDIDFTYFFSPNIEFVIGYSLLDWDVNNESPINLKARHKGNSKIRYRFANGINFNIRAQFVGGIIVGDEGVVISEEKKRKPKDYNLLHTHISVPLMDNMEIHAGIKNLTNRYDDLFGPMPGREWYFGFRYNFKEE